MKKPPRQILFVAAATALVLPGDTMLYAVLPSHFGKLGLTPIQVGVLLSANRWVRLVSNALAERCYRHGRVAPWLVGALGMGSLLMVVYGTVRLFPVLLLARLAWGVSFSVARQAGVMTGIGASHPAAVRENMGYLRGVTALGGVVGVLLGGLGHDLIGFTAILLVFCAVSLPAMPLGLLSQRGFSPAEPMAPLPLLGWGNLRLMACGLAAGMVGPGLVSATLGLVLKDQMGGALSLGGLTLGVATLTGAVMSLRWLLDGFGSPVFGAVGDRMGRERLVPLAFLLGALALLVAFLPTGLAGILAGVLVLFICSTFLGVLLASWAGLLGGRAMAAFLTAMDFGSGMGPLIGWSFAQAGIAPKWILLLGAAVYGCGFLASRGLAPPAAFSGGSR